jgi:predicted DNA binding CopG/RHH family protein
MRSSNKTARRVTLPRLESPQAEAEWFDSHKRTLSSDMRRRFQAGEGKTLAEALAQSAAKEKTKLKPVTIRMLPGDLALVRRLAFEKGLPYQTYVKVLLREALVRHTRGSKPRR